MKVGKYLKIPLYPHFLTASLNHVPDIKWSAACGDLFDELFFSPGLRWFRKCNEIKLLSAGIYTVGAFRDETFVTRSLGLKI